MYISRHNYVYLESLLHQLAEEKQPGFMLSIMESGPRGGKDLPKLYVFEDNDVFYPQAVHPRLVVTRTMIEEAYWATKGVM